MRLAGDRDFHFERMDCEDRWTLDRLCLRLLVWRCLRCGAQSRNRSDSVFGETGAELGMNLVAKLSVRAQGGYGLSIGIKGTKKSAM